MGRTLHKMREKLLGLLERQVNRMTVKRMAGNWFNVNNGAYCGIVMPEHVMKKLAKLYAKHNDEVKDLLTRYKDEIYPYEWALAYPNGEQKVVVYNATYLSTEERIKRYDENLKINRLEDFYVSDADTYSERQDEVIQLYMEKYDTSEAGDEE